ncbi:uncharacterized protein LOC125370820 isoform X2 [Ricinus communis]|uniref:Cysteine-rich transmembrane CYSTM domain-containing protein n=1 Tax=Ricinus communis TaxID=3988 RepID=B9RG85_RICCO|nr:uncharacterized protein LOC125370820 isoform X2 [Ricinus communis]EEF49540.1 conserved hypothetical protein [Ricinus communis]
MGHQNQQQPPVVDAPPPPPSGQQGPYVAPPPVNYPMNKGLQQHDQPPQDTKPKRKHNDNLSGRWMCCQVFSEVCFGCVEILSAAPN